MKNIVLVCMAVALALLVAIIRGLLGFVVVAAVVGFGAFLFGSADVRSVALYWGAGGGGLYGLAYFAFILAQQWHAVFGESQ